MHDSRSDSPRTLLDHRKSPNSSHLQFLLPINVHKELSRNANSTTEERQNIRIMEDGVNKTPKSLRHILYPAIEEKQLRAFDAISLCHSGSTIQLAGMSIGRSLPRLSSLNLIKSTSVRTNVISWDETMQSIASAHHGIVSLQRLENDSQAPSQFYLPRYDLSIFDEKPEKVTITLKETETFFLFEMEPMFEDLDTTEGLALKEFNERYVDITGGGRAKRKVVNAESQTLFIHTRAKSTNVGRLKRENRGTFVNNWVMNDASSETAIDQDVPDSVHAASTTAQPIQSKAGYHKFDRTKSRVDDMSIDDQLERIYATTSFRNATRVMERLVVSNSFVIAQKRFKGLIRENPDSLDRQITYRLDLLCTQSCLLTKGRKVSCFQWNPVNTNLLAAGYGASTTEYNGLLLVWSILNPSHPDKVYKFNSPVSDTAWSNKKPNQLAIGFYDGTIKVIDVSRDILNIMKENTRQSSSSYSPQWQVQWWFEDEQFDYQEQIYTSNHDGRIMRYSAGQDFTATEIMRIPITEGKIGGVKRTHHLNTSDIPITRNPAALTLTRHPDISNIYFVGTADGCVNRCSTNLHHQHIDSFLVHNGPVCSFEFSPFCSKIFLTCGADCCTRIWVDGITEPLITLSTMACVHGSVWSPTNSTIIASIVDNGICWWDIKRMIHRPTSITVSSNDARLLVLEFTKNGNQLIVGDAMGVIYVYSLEGMPFASLYQTSLLVKAIEEALEKKPALLRKLKKIASPYRTAISGATLKLQEEGKLHILKTRWWKDKTRRQETAG